MERNLTYHYYYYFLTRTSNPPRVCKPMPRVRVFPGLGSADLDPYPTYPTRNPWRVSQPVIFPTCGYDEATRQHQESQKPGSPMKDKSWHHWVPYKYTGCLAHVEITERSSDGEVSRIMGYFLHNEGCNKAVLTRLPAIPLHEHVYKVVIDQLEVGARYETCFLTVQSDLVYSTTQHFCSPNLQPEDD